MANDDLKKIKELLEIVNSKVGKLETHLTFRSATLELIKDQQSVMNEKLDRVEDKVDALTSDVIELQDQTKAVWDKIALGHTRNKREIDEIKRHLDMPLMPDTP